MGKKYASRFRDGMGIYKLGGGFRYFLIFTPMIWGR